MKNTYVSVMIKRHYCSVLTIILLAVILLVPASSVMAAQFNSPVHLSPATGDCMPFYFNGTYHLCMIAAGGWSHRTSTDLLNWTELPMIIETGGPADPDSDYCFTGDIIEVDGVYHMYYSGVSVAHPLGNMQCIHATSTDMINFTKHYNETWGPDGINYQTRAQSPSTNIEDPTFKDQRVIWNETEQQWWMFFSASFVDSSLHPAMGYATSDDLINWTQVPPLPGLPVGDCTDVFKIGNWWYRISNTSYWRAPALAGPWQGGWSGYSFDTWHFLVPKRMFDGTRHVLIGGMINPYPDPDAADPSHVYAVAIPREIYADADGWLCTRPVAEVTAVFDKPFIDLSTMPVPYALDVPLDYMMEATVTLDDPGTMLTIGFRQQPGDPDSSYKLTINRSTNEVSISRPLETYSRTVDLGSSGTVTIQAFVIGSIIECWVNDAYAFSLRDYDYPCGRLSFETNSGSATITSLKVSTDVDNPDMGGACGSGPCSDDDDDDDLVVDFEDEFNGTSFDPEWTAIGATLNGSGQVEILANQYITRSDIGASSFTMELDFDNLWLGNFADSIAGLEYRIFDRGTDLLQFFGIQLLKVSNSSNIYFRCWAQIDPWQEPVPWDPAYDYSVSLGAVLGSGVPYALKIVYDEETVTYTVSNSINNGPWTQLVVRDVPPGWAAPTGDNNEEIATFGNSNVIASLDYYNMLVVPTTCSQDPSAPDYVKGDLSGDCDVDLEDLGMFAEQWLSGM